MANRTSTLTLEIQDKFSVAQAKFIAQMNEAKQSVAELRQASQSVAAPMKDVAKGFDTSAFLAAARQQEEAIKQVGESAKKSSKEVDIFAGKAGNKAGNIAQNLAGAFGAPADVQNAIDLMLDGQTKAAVAVAGVGTAVAVGTKAWESYWREVDKARASVVLSATTLTEFQTQMNEAGNVKFAGQTFNLQVYADIGKHLAGVASNADSAAHKGQLFAAAGMAAQGNWRLALQMIEGVNKAQGDKVGKAQGAEDIAALKVNKAIQAQAEEQRKLIAVQAQAGGSTYELAQALGEVTKGYGEWTTLTKIQQAELINLVEAMKEVDGHAGRRGDINARMAADQKKFNEDQAAAEKEKQEFIQRGNAYRQQMAEAERRDGVEREMQMKRLVETQARAAQRIQDLDTQAAENRSNAYAAAAKDAQSSIQSIIQSSFELSQVTAQDAADSAAGTYKPKMDENLRRTRIFQTIDTDIDKDPEAQRILALLPDKIRAQLQQAFKEGGTKGLNLKATDLVGNMESFADLSGFNLDMVADKVQAQIEKMQNQKKMVTNVESILKARGIDPNSEETQKALGIETGSERAMKVNAKINIDKAQLSQEADKAKKELDTLLSTIQIGQPLAASAKTDEASISNAGGVAGESFLDGFGMALNDGAGNVYGSFLKALTGSLDERYVTKAKGRSTPS